MKLRGVTERTVSQFVKGRRERKRRDGKIGLAPWTIKNYLVALKTALAWAVEQKLLPELPKFPKTLVPKKKPQRMALPQSLKLWAQLLCGEPSEPTRLRQPRILLRSAFAGTRFNAVESIIDLVGRHG